MAIALAVALAASSASAQEVSQPKRDFGDLPLSIQLALAWPWVLARLGVFFPSACDFVDGNWIEVSDGGPECVTTR